MRSASAGLQAGPSAVGGWRRIRSPASGRHDQPAAAQWVRLRRALALERRDLRGSLADCVSPSSSAARARSPSSTTTLEHRELPHLDLQRWISFSSLAGHKLSVRRMAGRCRHPHCREATRVRLRTALALRGRCSSPSSRTSLSSRWFPTLSPNSSASHRSRLRFCSRRPRSRSSSSLPAQRVSPTAFALSRWITGAQQIIVVGSIVLALADGLPALFASRADQRRRRHGVAGRRDDRRRARTATARPAVRSRRCVACCSIGRYLAACSPRVSARGRPSPRAPRSRLPIADLHASQLLQRPSPSSRHPQPTARERHPLAAHARPTGSSSPRCSTTVVLGFISRHRDLLRTVAGFQRERLPPSTISTLFSIGRWSGSSSHHWRAGFGEERRPPSALTAFRLRRCSAAHRSSSPTAQPGRDHRLHPRVRCPAAPA